jgi:2-methylcitrate dehydratase PrpD
VHFHADAEADAAGFDKMTTIIRIHLKDGRVLTGRADFGKGSPAYPMSYEEVAEKFNLCAEFAEWRAAKSQQIVELVRNLESTGDMRKLVALCSA